MSEKSHDSGHGSDYKDSHAQESSKEHGHENHGKSHEKHSHRHSYHGKPLPSTIFVTVVVFLVLTVLFFLYYGVLFENLWLIGIGLILLFLVYKYDYILKLTEYERAIIFTLGRATNVVGPGWVVIFPPIQTFTKVDLRTKVIDIPPQSIVTKDGVEVVVDALLYLGIKKDAESVKKSMLEVQNYENAAKTYVIATLRDIAGALNLNELISNVDSIDKDLKRELLVTVASWGVEVESVKIQEIKIPEKVLSAMHEEKAALQEKLASYQRAAAHEREIETVKNATEGLSDKALAYYYVKALEKIGESSSTKFVLPMELTNLLDSLSTKKFSLKDITDVLSSSQDVNVKSIFKKKKKKKKKTSLAIKENTI